MLLLTAHGVPLVLEFHPALTFERFCELFSVLVGGNRTVETAPDILWCSCGRSAKCERSAKCFLFANAKSLGTGHCAGCSLGSTRQNARSGDLFRSFAAKNSLNEVTDNLTTHLTVV
jgi:hypothetical protein